MGQLTSSLKKAKATASSPSTTSAEEEKILGIFSSMSPMADSYSTSSSSQSLSTSATSQSSSSSSSGQCHCLVTGEFPLGTLTMAGTVLCGLFLFVFVKAKERKTG